VLLVVLVVDDVVVVVAPHAGSATTVHVSSIVTSLGAPAPSKVMRNCGSIPARSNGVRSTVPVSSICRSGMPGIGLPSLSSMVTEPLVYD